MWTAIALICYMTQADNFASNKIPQIPSGTCFSSVAPVVMKSEEMCMGFVATALNKEGFVPPGMQIFSFSCAEFENYHYKGDPA